MHHVLQIAHRLAIVAVMLVVGTLVIAFKNQPADQLAWITLGVADAVVLIAGLLLVAAYRRARPVRQLLGLIFIGLLVVHGMAALLLTHFGVVAQFQTYLKQQGMM